MSKASEWAKNATSAPSIGFVSPQGDYRIVAKVIHLFGPHAEDDDVMVLGLISTNGDQIGLRPEKALELARWILDTFGEQP